MNPETVDVDPEPIHGWFGLTYANYLVLPRSALQSMPQEWQERFVKCLRELDREFGYLEFPTYDVRCLARPRELIYFGQCPECDGDGFTAIEDVCPECDGDGVVKLDEPRYETPNEVGFIDDPIPHYNRGRTRLTPATARWEEAVVDDTPEG